MEPMVYLRPSRTQRPGVQQHLPKTVHGSVGLFGGRPYAVALVPDALPVRMCFVHLPSRCQSLVRFV